MSIFDDRFQSLEHEQFKAGHARGSLAVTLDVLTDALVLVGQHKVYCRNAGNSVRDLDLVQNHLEGAKDLIRSALDHLQPGKSPSSPNP